MDVTDSDIARIPRGNVRVPIEEFVAVWREACRRSADGPSTLGLRDAEIDWYDEAVAVTCRWMACAPSRTRFGREFERGPATRSERVPYEELIQVEYLASLDLERRRPTIGARPGWGPGVRATLRWAWRREGPPPVPVPVTPPA